MIANFFQNLTEIKEVEALIIFDNHQKVLDIWTEQSFNSNIIEDLGENVLHMFGLSEKKNYQIEEILVPFEKGILYLVNHALFFIVLVAKSTADISFIRITAEVCLYEFENHKKGKKILKKLPQQKFPHIMIKNLDDAEKSIINRLLEKENGSLSGH